jgi:excisionase family DNA binding protein
MSRKRKQSEEEKKKRRVYDVPEAGAMLGLSRGASYQAVIRGELPVIRVGRLLKVPKAIFDRMLGEPAE